MVRGIATAVFENFLGEMLPHGRHIGLSVALGVLGSRGRDCQQLERRSMIGTLFERDHQCMSVQLEVF